MKILAAVICCDYKEYSLLDCLEAIDNAGFDDVLLNFQTESQEDTYDHLKYNTKFSQSWMFFGQGIKRRKFDQDQNARLTPICIARNMVLDFAQQGDYDWVLFVDSDVLIPADTKDKLFNYLPYNIRSGVVPGRGIHSGATYMSYCHEVVDGWQRVDYATCGFMAIHKSVFWQMRFRWGIPLGGGPVASEDPIFGHDARKSLNEHWWVNLDLKAQHVGELREGETSQF